MTIGNTVVNIEADAFYNFNALTSIGIPYSVTNIGSGAFFACFGLTAITVDANNPIFSSVAGVLFDKSQTTLIEYPIGKRGNSYVIPNSVINLANDAFYYCTSLKGFYFQGNAPSANSTVFIGDSATNATIYYLPGTMGWSTTFVGLPTKLWNPQVQTMSATFGVQNNQFGFNITGTSNLVIVVESCTNVASPVWLPLSTNTLKTFIGTNGTSYFSDPQWANYPGRFYRLRSP